MTLARQVHNIPCVTFSGIPEKFASKLKAHMQGPPIGFLDLPREARDIIYKHSANWSDITNALQRSLKAWKDKSRAPPCPSRSTPTVLLLNKQITQEALQKLRQSPLTLVCPRDHGMQQGHQILNLLQLISGPTLRSVRHLTITLESWEWVRSY